MSYLLQPILTRKVSEKEEKDSLTYDSSCGKVVYVWALQINPKSWHRESRGCRTDISLSIQKTNKPATTSRRTWSHKLSQRRKFNLYVCRLLNSLELSSAVFRRQGFYNWLFCPTLKAPAVTSKCFYGTARKWPPSYSRCPPIFLFKFLHSPSILNPQHTPLLAPSSWAHLWSPPIVTQLCPAATALLTASASTWLANPTDRGYEIRLLYSSSLGTWVKFRSPKSYTWHPGSTTAKGGSEVTKQVPKETFKIMSPQKSVRQVWREQEGKWFIWIFAYPCKQTSHNFTN